MVSGGMFAVLINSFVRLWNCLVCQALLVGKANPRKVSKKYRAAFCQFPEVIRSSNRNALHPAAGFCVTSAPGSD